MWLFLLVFTAPASLSVAAKCLYLMGNASAESLMLMRAAFQMPPPVNQGCSGESLLQNRAGSLPKWRCEYLQYLDRALWHRKEDCLIAGSHLLMSWQDSSEVCCSTAQLAQGWCNVPSSPAPNALLLLHLASLRGEGCPSSSCACSSWVSFQWVRWDQPWLAMGELVAQPESVGRNSLLDPLSSSPQPGLDACSGGGDASHLRRKYFFPVTAGWGKPRNSFIPRCLRYRWLYLVRTAPAGDLVRMLTKTSCCSCTRQTPHWVIWKHNRAPRVSLIFRASSCTSTVNSKCFWQNEVFACSLGWKSLANEVFGGYERSFFRDMWVKWFKPLIWSRF